MNMQISIANAIGTDFIGQPNYITDAFINRVIADGGTFEAQYCLFNTLYGLSKISYPPFDPSAEAYFTATGITGATQQTAIDDLVKGLKQDGLWSKMKAIYPFVTDNRNLLSYTEDFGNAFWYKNAVTITTNSVTAPDGTLTADSIVENTANTEHYVGVSSGLTLTAVPYTLSVYLKKAGRDWFSLGLYNGTDSKYAWFNLNTGTIGTINSGVTANMESVGNGWYRCSVTRTMAANSNNYIGIHTSLTDGGGAYLGNGSTSTYLWGAQLELGSTATTYQPILGSQQAYISNQFKYNLVNPVDSDAAFRLVFNGGWTHSANGALPNGTNGYADTKLNPSLVLTNNNLHLAYYSRTNVNESRQDLNASNNVPATSEIFTTMYNNTLYFTSNIFSPNTASASLTNTLGFVIGNTTANNLRNIWKNGVKLATDTSTNSTALPNINVNISARANPIQEFSTKQQAFASIGDGLTDTEAANLYTAVQAFQTALSRQV